ncbi:MAG: hypothetical protein AAFQ08_00650, partial [Bacteroidota bacterium]
IGLWTGKNIKDIKEYAVTNKKYGTAVLLLTFLATNIGGGTLNSVSGVFAVGHSILFYVFYILTCPESYEEG